MDLTCPDEEKKRRDRCTRQNFSNLENHDPRKITDIEKAQYNFWHCLRTLSGQI